MCEGKGAGIQNIEDDELATLREIAASWLEADEERLELAIEEGFIQEVSYDERNQKAWPFGACAA